MDWTDEQVESWLADECKFVHEDIVWTHHSKSGVSMMFEVVLEVTSKMPMKIKGFYSPVVGKLTFAISAPFGRIYGLCIGECKHFDPATGTYLYGKRKHKYKMPWRDQYSYVPDDITSPWNEVEKT